MRQQSQLQLEGDDGRRSLRRCHGCGAYSRPVDVDGASGAVLCKRCAAKTRRERRETDLDTDPTQVSFVI